MINKKLYKKYLKTLSFLIVALAGGIIFSIAFGGVTLPFHRIFSTFFGFGTSRENFILFSVRLPRLVVVLLGGSGLALSGAILQSVTRNDLADSGIVGINSGAGVGITLFYLFFQLEGNNFIYFLPVVAFLGAMVTALAICFISFEKHYGINPKKMILSGIGISTALSGLMLVLISGSESGKVEFIVKWLNGNIWGGEWTFIVAILPWFITLVPYTLYKANTLNLIALNDETAIGLGLNLKKERGKLLFASVALSSTVISVTGGIAFIGLIAPHISKNLVGARAQYYIPISIILGALILLVADTVGRVFLQSLGIPTGIIVALIGAPYFLYLLIKKS